MLHFQEIKDINSPLGQKQLNDTLRDLWNKATNIQSRDIANGSVDEKKLKEGTIEARHIKTNAIEADHIKSDQIVSRHIRAGEVDTQHIKALSIKADQIDSNAIFTRHISSDSIFGEHIQANSIETKHIQANAITAESGILANLSVGFANIQNSAIRSAHIKDAEIKTAHIDDAQITNAKIQNGAITSAKIGEAQIETAHIGEAQIKSGHIDIAQIKSTHIEQGSINTAHIVDGAINDAKILEGSIGTAHISELSADLLTSGTIDTGAITIRDETGRLIITNNKLQVLDYDNQDVPQLYERVVLGKLEENDEVYGIRIRGKNGQTVLIDENGITNEGFTEGYNKLDDDSLNATKIDIDSIITKINTDGTNMIEGSKILLDGKTLDIEIFDITTKQGELETNISNNTTNITANANAIELKLDSQDFNSYKSVNDNNIATIQSDLSTKTTEISTLQGQIILKAEQSDLETLETITNGIASDVDTLQTQYSGITIELGSIDTRVGNVETEITTIDGVVTSHDTRLTSAEQKITDSAIVNTVRSSTSYIDDLSGKVSTDSIISSINQTAEEISIDASKIKLEGLTTINGDFRVYTNGSIFARNAEIGGTINVIDGSIGAMNIYDGMLEQSVFEYNPHGDIGYNVSFGIGEPDELGFYSHEVISVNRGEPGIYQVGRDDTPIFTVSKYGDVYTKGNLEVDGALDVAGDIFQNGNELFGIVESGSNENGNYEKWGNGLMLCWGEIATKSVDISDLYRGLYYGTDIIYFPKNFLQGSIVVGSVMTSSALSSMCESDNTKITWYPATPTAGSVNLKNIRWKAIGKWK